jgi:ribosomal protein S10
MKKKKITERQKHFYSPSFLPTVRMKKERAKIGRYETRIWTNAVQNFERPFLDILIPAYINSMVFVSTNKESLYAYKDFLNQTFSKKLLDTYIFVLPVKKKRIVLLKSPHVYKKAKEHFELQLFRFVFKTVSLSPILLKELILNKPKNIKCSLKSMFYAEVYGIFLIQAAMDSRTMY